MGAAFADQRCDAVKELIERQKIDRRADELSLLEAVLRFFGVANVDAWREGWETPQFAFRKSAAFAGQRSIGCAEAEGDVR